MYTHVSVHLYALPRMVEARKIPSYVVKAEQTSTLCRSRGVTFSSGAPSAVYRQYMTFTTYNLVVDEWNWGDSQYEDAIARKYVGRRICIIVVLISCDEK